MLVGNKKDLEGSIDVNYEEAAQFAQENGLVFVEASAKTGQNVEEAFLRTAQLISQSMRDSYFFQIVYKYLFKIDLSIWTLL